MRPDTLERDGRQLFVVSRQYLDPTQLPLLYNEMYKEMGRMLMTTMRDHREYVLSVARIDDATLREPMFTSRIVVEVEEVA